MTTNNDAIRHGGGFASACESGYIYIYREREREREMHTYIVDMHMYGVKTRCAREKVGNCRAVSKVNRDGSREGSGSLEILIKTH